MTNERAKVRAQLAAMTSTAWVKAERDKRKLSANELMDSFLWGVVAQLHPARNVLPPLHPDARQWFTDGQMAARQGYVRCGPDASPHEREGLFA